MYKYLYKFDEANNLIEESINNFHSKSFNKTTYHYDQNNNLIEKNKYERDTIPREKRLFTYNEKNIRTGELCYKYHLDWEKRYVMDIYSKSIFNEKGNEIECDYFSQDKYQYKIIYKYDSNSNIIEEAEYGINHLFVEVVAKKHTYTYNEFRVKTEECSYKNIGGTMTLLSKYNFDPKGNFTKSIENIYNKEVSCYYEFDDTGNWIRAVGFVNNFTSDITERQITYY